MFRVLNGLKVGITNTLDINGSLLTKFAIPRKINGVNFDGSQDINIPAIINPINTADNNTYYPLISNFQNSTASISSSDLFTYNPSTGNLTSKQFTSTIITGTPPFVINSITLVSNLNADLLDGHHGNYYYSPNNSPLTPITITKSLTLTTSWQDVGISGEDLSTGTYIMQLFANDSGAGGNNNNEYYSGTMSWYSQTTFSDIELPTDEIQLHRAGAGADGSLYLRTYRTNNGNLKLQIYANISNVSAANYVFKFTKII